MITNNGFMVTITVKSDMYKGQTLYATEKTAFSPRKSQELAIVPIDAIKGLDFNLCISAGSAIMRGEALEPVPAGATGTYFCRTGTHNANVTLTED